MRSLLSKIQVFIRSCLRCIIYIKWFQENKIEEPKQLSVEQEIKSGNGEGIQYGN